MFAANASSSNTQYYCDISPILKMPLSEVIGFTSEYGEGSSYVANKVTSGPGTTQYYIESETENSFTLHHVASTSYGIIYLF